MAESFIPPTRNMIDIAPHKPTEASLCARPGPLPEDEKRAGQGVPLNFRVDHAFRTEFRVYAAQRNLRLNQVLTLAFRALKRQEGAE